MICVCEHPYEYHSDSLLRSGIGVARKVCMGQVFDVDGTYFRCGCEEFKEPLAAALEERFGPGATDPAA